MVINALEKTRTININTNKIKTKNLPKTKYDDVNFAKPTTLNSDRVQSTMNIITGM